MQSPVAPPRPLCRQRPQALAHLRFVTARAALIAPGAPMDTEDPARPPLGPPVRFLQMAHRRASGSGPYPFFL